MLISNTTAYRL